MKRLLILATLLISITFLSPYPAAAGHAAKAAKPFPVTVVDDQGNKVTIAHSPKRIITLFADDTEIAFALGLENRLVADGSQYAEGATGLGLTTGTARPFKYPQEWPSKLGRDYPVKAPQLPHIEGGFSGEPFNLETIESLQPDLIIGPYYASQQDAYTKMRDLGLTVMFLDPANINGILHDITLMGKATGTTKQAGTLESAMTSRLASVKAQLKKVKGRPRVFYELDASSPDAPYTAGPRTVIDQAIRIPDGKNIADSVTSCSGVSCYPQMSLEAVVRADPQIILLADAPYGTKPSDVGARQGWNTISAVQSGKIYPVNPDLLSRFGPRIAIGVQDLAKLLHPAAIKKE